MVMTYNEIFLWLEQQSENKHVTLRFSDKDFFVSLVGYVENNWNYDSDLELPYCDVSVRNFCKLFGLSSYVVQSAISALISCGVLEKIKSPKTFRPLPNGNLLLNKPDRLLIHFPYFTNLQKSPHCED